MSPSSIAPDTSTVPSSATAGTFRPVEPNQRSRTITGRPPLPGPRAMSSTPGGRRSRIVSGVPVSSEKVP